MVENAIVLHMEWMAAVYFVVEEAIIHSDWSHAKNVNANFIGVVLCSVKLVPEMLRCIHANELKKKHFKY